MSLRDIIREVHGPSELTVLLSQYIRESATKKPSRDDGWHPSSVAGMCARLKVIEGIVGTFPSEPASVSTERIWDVGTSLHAWYQNEYFAKMGILWGKWTCRRCDAVDWGMKPSTCRCNAPDFVYSEVPFFAKIEGVTKPIVGHADGIVNVGGKWYLLEIKTININGFTTLIEPMEKHMMQAQIYAELAKQGKIQGVPVDVTIPVLSGIIFLYIAKNDSREKEYKVELDETLARNELKKIVLVETCLAEKRLPNRCSDCESLLNPRVKKCPARAHCFGQQSFADLERTR
jgi:hypothetical protein